MQHRPNESSNRLAAAKLSLDALSVGDAFGQCFFSSLLIDPARTARKHPPLSPWRHPDATEMAIVLVAALSPELIRCGIILLVEARTSRAGSGSGPRATTQHFYLQEVA